MSGDIREFLSKLPAAKRVDQNTCEFLDKEIRNGGELNLLQRDIIVGVVEFCVEQNLLLPSPYESFFAHVYGEWSEEARRSDAIKPRLVELVKRLKAAPQVASAVAQLAQQVAQRRQERHKAEMARLAAAAVDVVSERTKRGAAGAHDPPNAYVKKMQGARLGGGDNGMANLDLAAQYAEEAVEAYPNHPKVLFEAAGCHQLLSDRGKHLSVTDRYVHMKQAYTLYQQCLTVLANPPYVALKGECDIWRKGITELIPKVQEKLAVLEEKQQ
jgi:hypothetical protein